MKRVLVGCLMVGLLSMGAVQTKAAFVSGFTGSKVADDGSFFTGAVNYATYENPDGANWINDLGLGGIATTAPSLSGFTGTEGSVFFYQVTRDDARGNSSFNDLPSIQLPAGNNRWIGVGSPFGFFNVVSFGYNLWCPNGNAVSPPTRFRLRRTGNRKNSPRRTRRARRVEFDALSKRVISCAIEVHRELGPGLLESTYEHQTEGWHQAFRPLMPFVLFVSFVVPCRCWQGLTVNGFSSMADGVKWRDLPGRRNKCVHRGRRSRRNQVDASLAATL